MRVDVPCEKDRSRTDRTDRTNGTNRRTESKAIRRDSDRLIDNSVLYMNAGFVGVHQRLLVSAAVAWN